MNVQEKVISSITKIMKEDRKNIFFLLYYSLIEAILVMSIPLASSFIINSVLAHTAISVFTLGTIIIIIFILTTVLQIVKEYIVEKFQQKIFVTTGIEVAQLATHLKPSSIDTKDSIDKYMNYFFDISAIQKFFPILLLDGTGLIIRILASLLLLLAFDPLLFGLGVFFLVFFVVMLFILGTNGIDYAIKRSDAKHNAIYYLQNIPYEQTSEEKRFEKLDEYLTRFVTTRNNMFFIIMRQLTLTFVMEGIVLSSFLIGGGYLVINGTLPVGEFVAAEIIVVSIMYVLKGFMKHLDYIYDMIEGVYKLAKLSNSLHEHADV
ncbi:MAG: ABC transporter ATP-binding protein [Sulfuricurvum sp.]|nr:ABC transporter ATP-binding protein [Sulfuricurvum sp.]MDP3023691.1 ABC transporter ATP-binding protein [Sulfuricurvum sp.]MDP3119025.1 ABC transporter ATP-binding protein [Sulfuricurvum sp.]